MPAASNLAPPPTAPRRLYLARLEHDWRQAQDNLASALHRAGFLASPSELQATPIGRLLYRYLDASIRLCTYHRGRVNRLHVALRRTLGHEASSESARAAVLNLVYGRGGRRRDAAVLNEAERALLDQYRQMDAPARQMVRTLFARLAKTS